MKDIEEYAEVVLESLRDAVAEALESKRRLGQYAVFVENGLPIRVPADQLKPYIAAAKAKL